MSEFIPSGAFTVTSMIIVWSLGVYSIYKDRDGSRFFGIALLISWVFARSSTVTENGTLFAVGLMIAAILCVAPDNKIGKVLAFLYALRLLILGCSQLVSSDMFWFWEINRIVLYLQFIIISGLVFPQTGRNIFLVRNFYRG